MIFANEHYSATIHTNARDRLAVPSFDGASLPRGVILSNYDMTARNAGGRGFPTVQPLACTEGLPLASELLSRRGEICRCGRRHAIEQALSFSKSQSNASRTRASFS